MNLLSDPQLIQAYLGVFRQALPEAVLLGTAGAIFLFGCVYNRRWLWWLVAWAGVAAAMVVAGVVRLGPLPASSPLVSDVVATFVRWLVLVGGLALLLITWPEVPGVRAAEYYGCLLTVLAGASFVGQANELITLFLSLELVSIPTYVLLYLPRRTPETHEAALKYFLLSVAASAVLLFGWSYWYGVVGSTQIPVIAGCLASLHQQGVSPPALLGAVLILAGLSFRIAAVPFHFYAPDVYQGGPTGVVAVLAVVPKLVGLVALGRLFGLFAADGQHLPFPLATQWPLMVWIVAVITMSIGNVLALRQSDLRRMLAYSSIAHGGYMLMGIVTALAWPDRAVAGGTSGVVPVIGGMEAVLFYLAAYGLMTLGVFAVLGWMEDPDRPVRLIDDLGGLGRTHPFSALCLTVFLLSLIGMPFTAGFVGKLLLIVGVLAVPTDGATRGLYVALAMIAVVNAAVAAVYYLRVIGVIYLREPLRPSRGMWAVPSRLAVAGLVVATLVFGIYPQPLLRAARQAAPAPNVAAATATAVR